MTHWPEYTLEDLRPCLRCGKTPRLRQRSLRRQLVTHWFECRKWFGLRVCCRGPRCTYRDGWADFAEIEAIRRWNVLMGAA